MPSLGMYDASCGSVFEQKNPWLISRDKKRREASKKKSGTGDELSRCVLLEAKGEGLGSFVSGKGFITRLTSC